MTRALPDIDEEGRRAQSPKPYRRPRSPSPFTSGGRSQSLGARRFSGFSLASSGDHQQESRTKNPVTTNGITLSDRRRSGSQDRRRRLGMSTAELPPIANRPESARSKRSSRDSPNGIPKPTGIRKYERPELISVDSPTDSGVIPKRSHYSPGSTGSSNQSLSNKSGQGQTPGHINNPGFLKHRNNTWCATETTGKLGPLLERNGVQQNHKPSGATNNKVSGTAAPQTARMRHRFPSTTDSSTPSGQATLGQKTHSMTNLTKISDATSYSRNNVRTARQTTGMRHGRSEQTLNKRTAPVAKRHSVGTTLQTTVEPRRTGILRHSVSQPAMKGDQPLNSTNLMKGNRLGSQDSSESDTELNGRIMDWLVGVEQAVAPPNPTITDEEPCQTDTAIHIVYEGD